ncbi:MAG: hypothetical protein ACYS30_25270 [Planctomycetota bacterium]|jgi:hypothetical protein
MVTIEAENYEAAIKEARKQKRAAKRQEAIDKTNGEQAYVQAWASLGHITAQACKAKNTQLWTREPRVKREDEFRFTWQCETEIGSAETTFYKYIPTRTLLNGAGFAVAVEIQDLDNQELIWYAVGVFADKTAMIDIPAQIIKMVFAHLDSK